MSCSNCNDTPINIPINPVSIFTTSCSENPDLIDIKSYNYQGVNLPCSNIFTGNNMETVIQKIDAKLCGVIGDFSEYNMGCINSGAEPILTQQQFVEAISAFTCDLRDDFDEFVDITFDGYKTSVDNRFKLIEVPGIVSTTMGILSTSTIQNTLNVISGTIDNILNVKLNLSSVVWNDCFTVSPSPVTLQEGFQTVLDQICLIKDGQTVDGSLPTFNNVGSCLPTPVTSSDTLVATVNKIKTRLCELPDFDINDLTWGCTTKPSSEATDLQAAFQTVLNTTNDYKQNKLTFSGDFVITPTGSDACGGKTVSLSIPSSQDRYVAVNVGDTSPGTLVDKLQAGTNITFDAITTPGKLIITSVGGGTDTKVKTETTDPSAGYLEDKIKVSTNSNGISITKSTDLSDHKVALGTSINGESLWNFLLDFLDANPDTYEAFCERVTGCLPDCIIPPNVTVIYDTSTTTSTTTTTTTTAP